MIIPAIFEKEFNNVLHKVKLVEGEARLIQIDIADGKLVDGNTFQDISKLDEIQTDASFEIHLMVENPLDFLKNKVKKVTKISCHVEAETDLGEFINKAKELGYKTGLSLNPETPINTLDAYIYDIDFVQLMTVSPGSQGREFQKSVLKKVVELKDKHPDIPVQVDGGVNEENLLLVLNTGVNDVVIGSAIFSDGTKKPRKIRKVAFLGGASWQEDDQVFKDAVETAKLLCLSGYEIINGGGPGVMRAATIGAHEAGGRSLAVTYHPNKIKKNYEGVDPLNKFDEEIYTLDYFDRTKVMLQNSDVHIIFNGSSGTISELGMSWANSRIHEENHKPIILFGGFWEEIIAVLKKNMYIRPGEDTLLTICHSPEEVLTYIKSLEG
jgi:ribulose-phosphate 3-epimerase